MQTGVIDVHVDQMRLRSFGKCEQLLEVLRRDLGDAVEFVAPRGGLYLWARLPAGVETGMESRLFARALEEKVLYVPGEMCLVQGSPAEDPSRRSMRLCYSFPPDDELSEAGARLARAIASVL